MGVNWATGLMRWQPYVSPSGKAYPVNHLHPFRIILFLPASSGSDDIELDLEVGFSMHTFTRGRCAADSSVSIYADARECRTFDEERYALSHRLPDLVRSLTSRKCYHARNQNYLSVDGISTPEVTSDYRVFFVLRRSRKDSASQRSCVRLIVQSAYATPPSSRGKERPIRFRVLLRRVLGLSAGSKKRRPRTNAGPRSPNLLDIPLLVRTPEGG
jgi:hypothetical protein